MNSSTYSLPGFLFNPTRFLFFTGKGGVGKTSLSAASALKLSDAGQRVLLVSTDAASNLDEMLGVRLSNKPVPVPGAPGLSVLNIDPDVAAEAYRQRVRQRSLLLRFRHPLSRQSALPLRPRPIPTACRVLQ